MLISITCDSHIYRYISSNQWRYTVIDDLFTATYIGKEFWKKQNTGQVAHVDALIQAYKDKPEPGKNMLLGMLYWCREYGASISEVVAANKLANSSYLLYADEIDKLLLLI